MAFISIETSREGYPVDAVWQEDSCLVHVLTCRSLPVRFSRQPMRLHRCVSTFKYVLSSVRLCWGRGKSVLVSPAQKSWVFLRVSPAFPPRFCMKLAATSQVFVQEPRFECDLDAST